MSASRSNIKRLYAPAKENCGAFCLTFSVFLLYFIYTLNMSLWVFFNKENSDEDESDYVCDDFIFWCKFSYG